MPSPQRALDAACRAGRGSLLSIAVLFATGCSEPPSGPPNVLLVTIDTLRADHLEFYGYDRATMPRLAEWVHEGTIFESCYTPLPLTDPSISSIMTGLHPVRHGVRHVSRRLRRRFTTLAQVMRSHGYATAAFVSRTGLVDKAGLGRGFDVADYEGGKALDRVRGEKQRKAEEWQRRADHVTEAVLAWLDQPREKPFFVWLHYFDPHAFYDPPAAFRNAFREGLVPQPADDLRAWWGSVADRGQTVAAYDAEILAVDHHLAKVVDRLEQKDSWDSTLFLLTSDHGESLGEHGHMDHGEWLFDEQIHVPLVMRLPGSIPAGKRVPELVRLFDLAPTIINLTGIVGDDVERFVTGMDGRSILNLLHGFPAAPRRIFVESEDCPSPKRADEMAPGMVCHPVGVEGKLRATYDGQWKLIVTPLASGRRYELYDLVADPDESTNLSRAEPERVRTLARAIDRFWQIESPRAPVDEELAEQLRALGYAD
jgi:arylsulfatase A-like enzyme